MERSYRFRRQTLVPSTGRTYNLRRSAPFRLPRIGWIPILGLMAVVVLGWFMFGSRVFRISRVEIHGSLNDAVATQLNALKGKNLILLSTGTLESTLPREQPSIRSLHLVKGFPDTLQVDVTVRSPKLIWKVNDAVYYIDDEGIVFTFEGSAPNVDANSLAVVSDTKAQPVTVGSQLVSSAFVDFITGIATKFHDASGLTVTGISVG